MRFSAAGKLARSRDPLSVLARLRWERARLGMLSQELLGGSDRHVGCPLEAALDSVRKREDGTGSSHDLLLLINRREGESEFGNIGSGDVRQIAAFGDYTPGRWGWILTDVQALRR